MVHDFIWNESDYYLIISTTFLNVFEFSKVKNVQ